MLNPSQQKIAAASLLAALTVAAITAIAWPLVALHRHYDRAIEAAEDQLIRYRDFASQTPQYQAAIAAAETRQTRQYFLRSNNPVLAAAELQDVLKSIIEAKHGKVASTQVIPAVGAERYQKIAIKVDLSASAPSLQQILYTIETHVPLIFIDAMTVRAGQGRRYQPVVNVEPQFGVQLEVSAYGFGPGQ